MNIVVAMDSFKGSLSSMEAGFAVAEGIYMVYPDANVEVRPLADGGEGTVSALTLGLGGHLENVNVTDPIGRKINAVYGIKGCTAMIEMASAAGITLLEKPQRNPYKTSTYGVGEMIWDAIRKGCRHFLIGIGGSATNDGGIGMLQALGYEFLDENGEQVCFGAEGLRQISCIKDEHALPELEECTFRIACDVKNPLCGEQGCSAVFAPQKGATPAMIIQMDQWLSHFAKLTKEKYAHANPNQAGAGAAGGLGFAFMSFLNARLESGIQIVLHETRLEQYVEHADLVITGEGCLDAQTIMGKAPIGVAKLAKKYNKNVIAFSGSVSDNARLCNTCGVDAFFPIVRRPVSLAEAMDKENARRNMIATVEQVFRLYSFLDKENKS